MKLSKSAVHIIAALNAAGFMAYAVGGCVRDSLLSKPPSDWDIATNATPKQVRACFPSEKTIDTGLKHGTVTVVTGGEATEITTFRIDGEYSDGRRPDDVTFTDSLKADLSRRDFTINALAYHPKHGVIDYFGGGEDLRNRVIRCVGDPDTRFSEDALRILRAVRFSAQLGFAIEDNTLKSMEKLARNLNIVSAERIFSELCKTLKGANAAFAIERNIRVMTEIIPEITPMIGFCQHSRYHHLDLFSHTITALRHSPCELAVRLAVLLHDIGKPYNFTLDENGEGHFYGHAAKSATLTEERLLQLRCQNELRDRVVYLVKHHGDDIKPERTAVKRALNKMGEGAFRELLAVKRADASARKEPYAVKGITLLDSVISVLDEVLLENEAFTLNRLAVNGKDLILIGFKPGKQLGMALDILLEGVITGVILNEREHLLNEARKYL